MLTKKSFAYLVIVRSNATRDRRECLWCNLPVQSFDTATYCDGWYREIAPKGIPFGPTSGAPLTPSSQWHGNRQLFPFMLPQFLCDIEKRAQQIASFPLAFSENTGKGAVVLPGFLIMYFLWIIFALIAHIDLIFYVGRGIIGWYKFHISAQFVT